MIAVFIGVEKLRLSDCTILKTLPMVFLILPGNVGFHFDTADVTACLRNESHRLFEVNVAGLHDKGYKVAIKTILSAVKRCFVFRSDIKSLSALSLTKGAVLF